MNDILINMYHNKMFASSPKKRVFGGNMDIIVELHLYGFTKYLKRIRNKLFGRENHINEDFMVFNGMVCSENKVFWVLGVQD